MSYLNTLRLHFAGQFQCNVSTVNNDPGHYDNSIFQPSYQTLQGKMPNGWFNPQGDAAFRLLGCTVTGARRSFCLPHEPRRRGQDPGLCHAIWPAAGRGVDFVHF
jgi:hypothetical protein